MAVSESEKLMLNITATVQFSFGTICDRIAQSLEKQDALAEQIVDCILDNLRDSGPEIKRKVGAILRENAAKNIAVLQRETRNNGNNSIRVIDNHLQHFRILRRHKRDVPNADRIAKKHTRNGVQNGDS